MATVAATAVLGVVIALIFWALHKWMKQVSVSCSMTLLARLTILKSIFIRSNLKIRISFRSGNRKELIPLVCLYHCLAIRYTLLELTLATFWKSFKLSLKRKKKNEK